MNEIIVQDRITLENVALTIGDGVFTMTITAEDAGNEPVIADSQAGKRWKLFVADGVLAWEETTDIALVYNELIDTATGIKWRLYILDGQFAYSHIISVSRALDSRVSIDEGRFSVLLSQEDRASSGGDDTEVSSEIGADVALNSGLTNSITLESRLQ